MTTTDRAALLAAVKDVSNALAAYDYLPILSHVCIDRDIVFAYDDATAIVSPIDDIGITCAVPGIPFRDVLSRMGGDTVDLSLDDGVLTVKSGRARTRLYARNESEFMFDPRDVSYKPIGRMTEELVRALDLAQMALPPRAVYIPQLNGVMLMHDAVYASDTNSIISIILSKSLCKRRIKYLLPPIFVKQVTSAAFKKNPPFLGRAKDGRAVMCTRSKQIRVFSKLGDAPPPDFAAEAANHLTDDVVGNAVPLPPDTHRIVERAAGLGVKEVRCEIGRKSLRFYSATQHGEASEKVSLPGVSPVSGVEVAIDVARFSKALQQFDRLRMFEDVAVFVGSQKTLPDAQVSYLLSHQG